MEEKKGIIVVPYRDREAHLSAFLKAQNGKQIIIVEQENEKPFNRGKLLNIGFHQSTAYDYFIFHDVDMIPVLADYKPDFNCPVHIATKVQQFNYKLPYPDYFGGVTILAHDHFIQANGFPNDFWGWGAEDDELRRRIETVGLKIKRRNCRFLSLKHPHQKNDTTYFQNVEKFHNPINANDGLNTLEYQLISDRTINLVRHIVVSI